MQCRILPARLTACLMLVLASPTLHAQQPVVLTGRIASALDTLVNIPDAAVTIDDTVRLTTDVFGRFRAILPRRREYHLNARRLGFSPVSLLVRATAGDSLAVFVRLEPIPTQLANVRVNGRTYSVEPRFVDAYRRAENGFGRYFFADEIARQRPFDTKSLLAGIAGIHVNERGVFFQRCGNEPPVVYVDGVRLTRTMSVNDALRSVPPSRIQIMEVYSGPAQLPAEFTDGGCAVIAVTTR